MTAQYLVWSNEHQMWWRANHSGYTPMVEQAGRYDLDAAQKIVSNATLDGQLDQNRTDPVTGRHYRQTSEVLLLAPESIAGFTDAFNSGRLAGQVELAQDLMDVRATYDAVERAGRPSGGES